MKNLFALMLVSTITWAAPSPAIEEKIMEQIVVDTDIPRKEFSADATVLVQMATALHDDFAKLTDRGQFIMDIIAENVAAPAGVETRTVFKFSAELTSNGFGAPEPKDKFATQLTVNADRICVGHGGKCHFKFTKVP